MKRFIMISTLPDRLAQRVKTEQEELSHLTGAKEAMLYPPHMTLRTGALVPVNHIETYIEGLKGHLKDNPPIALCSQRVTFETYLSEGQLNYFIGYKISLSPQLREFHETLWEYPLYAKSKRKEFYPHISLAYKDLSAEKYAQAKEVWKPEHKEPLQWDLDGVSLYHQVEGEWQLHTSIDLTLEGIMS